MRIFAGIVATSFACPNGWTESSYDGEDSCWKLLDGSHPGSNAKQLCANEDATVPLPKSQEANNDLQAILNTFDVNTAWIAITDVVTEGTWLDFEGNPFGSGAGNSFQLDASQNFVNWNPNPSNPEPNNAGNEDYTTIARSNGKWNDHYASNPVVCNKPNQKVDVTSCNTNDGTVAIHAHLNFADKTYTEFDASDNAVFHLADGLVSSFLPAANGNPAYLVLTKTLGSDVCEKKNVDGIQVCVDTAEMLTLQCKYPLGDRTINDSYQVTGQDTAATAENTGTLGYTLNVKENKNIGETVEFEIIPDNAGLVAATIKHCDVKKTGETDITIIGDDLTSCKHTLIGVNDVTAGFSSKGTIEGSWTAFKWSTTAANNVESQSLECLISLSENVDSTPAPDC